MVSKNVLAVLVIIVLIFSLTSTFIILKNTMPEPKIEGRATARVEVVAEEIVPSSTGFATVMVLEKPKGG